MNSKNHIDIVLTEMIKGMKDFRRHNFRYAYFVYNEQF